MKTFSTWRWWTVALRGLVAIAFGILSLIAPEVAFVTLAVLFGIFAIVDGVLALGLARRVGGYPRSAIVVRGLLSLAAGIVALVWPSITAFALLVLIGIWAIASGIFEIVTAILMRQQLEHEWLLATEGVVSVGFGVVLLVSPLAGAVVLGLWVGAYALVLGAFEFGTGLRLRSYARAHPGLPAAA